MRAIVYDRAGASDVLRLEERPLPDPGPGEVRIRVVVSGVNPTDWKRRAGQTSPVEGEAIPNQDGAGVVDAVGSGVDGLSVGDRVWVHLAQHEGRGGTAAEYTTQPVRTVVRLPEGVSFDVGASLGVPAMTAHRALTCDEDGPRQLSPGALDGRTVLVSGGAGAVGHAAIQLARWAGATVVTTVSSPEKADLARAAGAHHTVDYRREDAGERILHLVPGGVDTVVEVDIVHNADVVDRVLRPRGTVALYANSGPEVVLPMRAFMSKNARLQFVLLYTVGEEALAAAADDITAALADGALPVGGPAGLPIHRFPLDRTADAHDAVERGAVGKVLIDVSTP